MVAEWSNAQPNSSQLLFTCGTQVFKQGYLYPPQTPPSPKNLLEVFCQACFTKETVIKLLGVILLIDLDRISYLPASNILQGVVLLSRRSTSG